MMEYTNISVTPVNVRLECKDWESPLAVIPKGSKVGEAFPFEFLYSESRIVLTVKEYDKEENELLGQCVVLSDLPGTSQYLTGTISFCKDYRICIACREPIVPKTFVYSSFYEKCLCLF